MFALLTSRFRWLRGSDGQPVCQRLPEPSLVASQTKPLSFTAIGFTPLRARSSAAVIRCAMSCLGLMFIANATLAQQAVQFDLPATSAATLVTSEPAIIHQGGLATETEKTVVVDFHLSTILAQLSSPQIEQLVVQIKPLGGASLVADYSPRTEFSSHLTTDIAVCESSESSDHVGLGIQGSYSDMVRGNVGADKGHKQAQESKYAKLAPQHVVAASGTTHRGHGVYFKLRSDARQVIDGDRTFSVSLRVPAQWRGELVEFRVQAEAMVQPASSPFTAITGSTPKLQQLGVGRFLVAVYLENDDEAARTAKQLARAEQALREMATRLMREPQRSFSVPKDVYVAFVWTRAEAENRLQPKRCWR